MTTRIQLRRDTAIRWTSINPVLAAGEPAVESDTGKLKVGDGTSVWSALPYILDVSDLTPVIEDLVAAAAPAPYTDEQVRDVVGATMVGDGDFIAVTTSDAGNTIRVEPGAALTEFAAGERTWTATQIFEDADGNRTIIGAPAGNQTKAPGAYLSFYEDNPGLELANGTSNWRVSNDDGTFGIALSFVARHFEVHADGAVRAPNGSLNGKYVGGMAHAGTPRQPFGSNVVIDGSELGDEDPANKVGQVNAVTFRGGFTGEAALGAVDPGFVFGANDFILSGTNAGDLDGITDFYGRLIETHASAPGTALNVMKVLQVEGHLEPEAVGGSIGDYYGIHVIAPRNGGTIDTAYGIFIESPALADDDYALFVSGTSRSYFGGAVQTDGNFKGRTAQIGDPSDLASGGQFTAKSDGASRVSAQIVGRGDQAADIFQVLHDGYGQPAVRVSKDGAFVQTYPIAPADSELINNELAMWVDGSSGAMKLMLKGRDNGGVVRTGQVTLS